MVFQRQPGTLLGRQHAVTAISQYSAINSKVAYTRAAETAESLLDQLPATPAATEAGWQAVYQWRRGSDWAKSNLAAKKMLQKGLPKQRRSPG